MALEHGPEERRELSMNTTGEECFRQRNRLLQGFSGGPVVKDPPAKAGDTGSIPGPGRSRVPWSSEACAPQC